MDCAVTKGVPARIDARSSVRVNHEIYFVSTPSALRSFRRNPLKYCGDVTDPVSLERFRPDKKSPRMDWGDRPYFFASDSTLAEFREDPEMYAERPAAMVPKPESEETDAGGTEAEETTGGGAAVPDTKPETERSAAASDTKPETERSAAEPDASPSDAPDGREAAFIGPMPEPQPPADGDC